MRKMMILGFAVAAFVATARSAQAEDPLKLEIVPFPPDGVARLTTALIVTTHMMCMTEQPSLGDGELTQADLFWLGICAPYVEWFANDSTIMALTEAEGGSEAVEEAKTAARLATMMVTLAQKQLAQNAK